MHPSHGVEQQIDFPHQQIVAAALQQVHREEPGPSGTNARRQLGMSVSCRVFMRPITLR